MNALDEVNGYDEVLLKGATFEQGIAQTAFRFRWDGRDDYSTPYMLVENAGDISNLEQFTMEMWVKPEGAPIEERTRIERFMTIAPPGNDKASIQHDGRT